MGFFSLDLREVGEEDGGCRAGAREGGTGSAVASPVQRTGSCQKRVSGVHHQSAALSGDGQERPGVLECPHRRADPGPSPNERKGAGLACLQAGHHARGGDVLAALRGLQRPLRLGFRSVGSAPVHRKGDHVPAGPRAGRPAPQRHDQGARQHGGRGCGQVPDLQGYLHQRDHLLHPAADLGCGQSRQGRA